jgi:hypothetical protein
MMSHLTVLNLLIVERRPKENWVFIKCKEDSEQRYEVEKIERAVAVLTRTEVKSNTLSN